MAPLAALVAVGIGLISVGCTTPASSRKNTMTFGAILYHALSRGLLLLGLPVLLLNSMKPTYARSGCHYVWSRPVALRTDQGDLVYVERPRILGGTFLLGDTIVAWTPGLEKRAAAAAPSFLARLTRSPVVEMLPAPVPPGWVGTGPQRFITFGTMDPQTKEVVVLAASPDASGALWQWEHLPAGWKTPTRVGIVEGLVWSTIDPSVVSAQKTFALIPRKTRASVGVLAVSARSRENSVWSRPAVAVTRVTAHSTLVATAGRSLVLAFLSTSPRDGEADRNSVFAVASDTSGLHWGSPTLLWRSGTGSASAPIALADIGGTASVIWLQTRPGAMVPDSLRLQRSGDGGRTWVAGPSLGRDRGYSAVTAVVDATGDIHVVLSLAGDDGGYWHATFSSSSGEWVVDSISDLVTELDPVLGITADGNLVLFSVSLREYARGAMVPTTLMSTAKRVCPRER